MQNEKDKLENTSKNKSEIQTTRDLACKADDNADFLIQTKK